MIVKCGVLEGVAEDEEQKLIKTYGLRFYESGNENHGLKLWEHLFFEKGIADRAAKLINENDLCDVHIPAVIEDLLA